MAANSDLLPYSPSTIADALQNYCDILLDDATGIKWDLYRPDQRDKLDLKVRLALYEKSVKVDELTGQVILQLSIARCRLAKLDLSSDSTFTDEHSPTGRWR